MKKIPVIVSAMLLLTYGYLFMTVKPSPVWEPQSHYWVCFTIGGGQYCIEIPDDEE